MLRTSAIYLVGRFGAAVITLLSVAIYTRLLSPGEYGVYALALSGVLMAYAGMMQWLTVAAARFLPAYQGREEIVLSHVATAYGATALLVLAGACVLVPWLVSATHTRIMLALGVGIFLTMTLAELILVTFQMGGKAYRYIQFALLRVTVAAAIGVTLAYLGWGSVGLLYGVMAGHLCIVLPNLATTWGLVRRTLLRKQSFRELAAYGFPFAMTGALAAIINASDRYIIGILIGTDAAGLYAAPYDLAMRTLHVLMMVVAMAGNPIILRTYETAGEAAARPLIQRQVELMLGLALPAAIACTLLAPVIVDVFLGEAFHATALLLMPWIALGTIINGFQGFHFALSFSLPKKPLRQTHVFVFGAVINAVLNFALIPRMGLIGAAVATVAAYVFILAGSFYVGRQLFPLPFPCAGAVKILLACGGLALVLWPVSDTTAIRPVLLHALLGAGAYLAIFCGLDVADTRRLCLRAVRLGLIIMRWDRLGFG